MAEVWKVWCRSLEPLTRWHVLDDDLVRSEEVAIKVAADGNANTVKYATYIRYLALPKGKHPNQYPKGRIDDHHPGQAQGTDGPSAPGG